MRRALGRLRAQIFLRSLLLQACWNFERMQGLGFAYCLEPWLKKCWGEAAERRAALSRHFEFFNTQPYMAPLVVGMVCALEEDAAASAGEREVKIKRLRALKKAAAGALAGIGDALFWGSLRPFCAALALLSGIILWRTGSSLLWMPLIYLAAYNAPAAALRWRGFAWGYEWGEQIASRLKDFPWQSWIGRTRAAGAALALCAAALLLAGQGVPGSRRVGGVMTTLYLIAFRALDARASSARLYAGTCLFGVIAAAAGWV